MKRVKQAAATASEHAVWVWEWKKTLASRPEAAERLAEELARKRPLQDIARSLFGKKKEAPHAAQFDCFVDAAALCFWRRGMRASDVGFLGELAALRWLKMRGMIVRSLTFENPSAPYDVLFRPAGLRVWRLAEVKASTYRDLERKWVFEFPRDRFYPAGADFLLLVCLPLKENTEEWDVEEFWTGLAVYCVPAKVLSPYCFRIALPKREMEIYRNSGYALHLNYRSVRSYTAKEWASYLAMCNKAANSDWEPAP